VTGGVADGQEDRLAAGFGFLEGFGPPTVPMDRVVLVKEKIRAGFLGEAIGAHLFFFQLVRKQRDARIALTD
jgi:hypothetical protein